MNACSGASRQLVRVCASTLTDGRKEDILFGSVGLGTENEWIAGNLPLCVGDQDELRGNMASIALCRGNVGCIALCGGQCPNIDQEGGFQ